jgi:phosphatidylserine/phosphatidylglycerophosphate/cardiolipin synthase-like enzyme
LPSLVVVWLLVAPAVAPGAGAVTGEAPAAATGPHIQVTDSHVPRVAGGTSPATGNGTRRPATGNGTRRPATGNDSRASVVAAYPNPVTDGDVGEYVLIRVHEPTDVGEWTVGDGEARTSLPNETLSGLVLVAANVSAALRLRATVSGSGAGIPENATPVVATGFSLSNAGERIVVTNASGSTVAVAEYEDAPEGERLVDGEFRPVGATDFDPATTTDVRTRTFVTPDLAVPLAPIRNATDSIRLAGYTFASERVADALARAVARSVHVRVLVDDAPVGGVTRRQVHVLDRLVDAGVDVRALGGDRARYEYQHAKYLVADDTAMVLTENWKPSGTGGHANRGWGVVLRDRDTAAALRQVFDADWTAPDARNWTTVQVDEGVDPAPAANGTYRARVPSRNVTVESVTVATAPDNAERVLVDALRNATDRVLVLQMTAARDGVLVRETIAAARRDVDVRVLLSSAWYAREANARLVDALNALADRESIPLTAKLVDPDGRFQKVHAKGVVVDDSVVVGSVNWNDHSLRANREVAVVLHGDAAATYYADAFDRDWQGGTRTPVPPWLAATTAIAVLALLGMLARRIDFER